MGSEMCIRDSLPAGHGLAPAEAAAGGVEGLLDGTIHVLDTAYDASYLNVVCSGVVEDDEGAPWHSVPA